MTTLTNNNWNPEISTATTMVGMTVLLFTIFSWLYYSQSGKFPFFKYFYFKEKNKLFVAGGYIDSSGELLELAKLDKQLSKPVAFFWTHNNYDDIARTFRKVAKAMKEHPSNAVLMKGTFQSKSGAGVVFSSFNKLPLDFTYLLLAIQSNSVAITPAEFSKKLKTGSYWEILPRIEEKRGMSSTGTSDVVLFGLTVNLEKVKKFLKQRHDKFELIEVKSLDELIKKRATC